MVRDGGDLVERSVQYIIPDGESEFYGATNILVFPPGVKSKTFSLAAISDGVPEVKTELGIMPCASISVAWQLPNWV